MSKHSPARKGTINPLIFLHVLLGIGAVVSGILLVIKPDGSLMQMPLSVMQGSPFTDFLIPGIILLIFLGILPLFIAYGLWKRPLWHWPDLFNPIRKYHWSWTGSLAVGVILVIWLAVELIWVDFALLHLIYFIWAGVIILITLNKGVRYFLRHQHKPVLKH